MAKHLPPSAASLNLLDVNGAAGSVLSELRDDLIVTVLKGHPLEWLLQSDSADAVTAYDVPVDGDFLGVVLHGLRPGGRLIVVDSHSEVSQTWVKILEDAGYTRILVETAAECPGPVGVLVRGEKPHHTLDTTERIQSVADRDTSTKTRYLHFLICQLPNKPVWNLQPEEKITWSAAAVDSPEGPVLLAFISLPKAVAFMQQAILANKIKDINKVGKFKRDIAASWVYPLLVNPDLDSLDTSAITFVALDPDLAESPDE